MSELPSQYSPKDSEKSLYESWEKAGYFHAKVDSDKPKWTLIMPPPNVTGILHMGHALMATLEDVLTRRKRMQGFEALYLPGTDHAGIATQMVVERKLLKEEGKTKHDIGREEFLKKVWQWKEESQGTIHSQLRKIGTSCDWERLCFTLDETPVASVRECFKRLYDDGLIYREEAMIQWCPRCRTALSDLEVKFEDRKGSMWDLKYVLKDDPSKSLTVSTTRPETLLGDTAVAIHPEDERYKDFHGKTVVLPLLGREIPVVLDDYVDREFGTGALKITPAHDPNDYEIGKRHKLGSINIFDDQAQLNEAAGPYQGLSREEGRKKILKDLEDQGLLLGEKKHANSVGTCDRCKTLVEPKVSTQWFVNAAELAKDAIADVRSGEIEIVPKEWESTYFHWMENIRPWCISRQLWWGHRIPAWHCLDCGEVTVDREEPKACKCGSSKLKQDDDVLDTWFSSGLWPISTLGWPNEDHIDLKTFYPTQVMETGFDILFFWVARMIMMCKRMTGQNPFKTIYLHPMVRDEYGQKMSKTKGNVVDPLQIIDTTGADSLRYYFTANTFHGRDIRVTDGGLEGARNFVNKVWNASRFVLMHFGDVKKPHIDDTNEVNQWIWTSLNDAKREMNRALDEYRFFDAAQTIYHFLWDSYCSWFVELIKAPEELAWRKEKGDSTAVQVLEEVLRLAHPIMPFVTEEIWQKLPIKSDAASIMVADYPEETKEQNFPKGKANIDRVIEIVDAVRTYRGTTNVNPKDQIGLEIRTDLDLERFEAVIQKLVNAKSVSWKGDEPSLKDHVLVPLKSAKVFIPKADLGDLSKEMDRKKKELEDIRQAITRADKKLSSPNFTDKAPEKVVQGVRDQKAELEEKAAALAKYVEGFDA